jgi:Spy/CpxP family protein refolding chaperone
MKTWLFIIGLSTAAPVIAQHDAHQSIRHATPAQPQAHAGHSPYVGMQNRAIMALSDQQVADLRAGRGMSLALPAELNGYPGPSHALELATALALTAAQKLKTQSLFEKMQAEAKALGEQLILSEYELDRLFRDKKASSASVQEATAKAARVQGQLRASHLQYHLKMVDVLTPDQVAKYNELRGYQ